MLRYKEIKAKKEFIDAGKYGFSFHEDPVDFSANIFIICLIKAMLVFCCVTGTLGGLLSAFHINYNKGLFLLVMGVLSFTLAFLHYNNILFNTLYPILFFLFAFLIIRNRIIVMSGYQSFITVLFEEYTSYFDLIISREVSIPYKNQYVSITITAIFIGFFIALLLNIAVSTYMSLFLMLLLTFPFLQLSIYIEKFPSAIYLILILFSYVATGILGRSKHFEIPLKKKKRKNFEISKNNRKKTVTHTYVAKGTVLRDTALLFLVFSIIFSAFSYSMITNNKAQAKVSNALKAKTDLYVKNFVMSGLSGLFDRYQATGGISNGRLGGVSSVRPDLQTDLKVTLVPYTTDTIYLKAFVGANYTGSSWEKAKVPIASLKEIFKDNLSSYLSFNERMEAKRLKALYQKKGKNLHARMRIENVDAAELLYLPYYTDLIAGSYTQGNTPLTGSLAHGNTMEVSYYPPKNTGLATGTLTIDAVENAAADFPLEAVQEENDFAEIAYMNDFIYNSNIPPSLIPTLRKIADEIGTVFPLEQQAILIQQYLAENYTYSSSPGMTPHNEDFVNYFLTANKKGYCAHFASAATLLFRFYGYPARYVEGYVISPTNLTNGEIVSSEKHEDYLSGENPLNYTDVLEVSISDANAHAWVEVYKDGFGWIPIEATLGLRSEENVNSSAFSFLSGLFSLTLNESAASDAAATAAQISEQNMTSFLNSTKLVTGPLFILIVITVLFCIVLFLTKYVLAFVRRTIAFNKGNYSLVLPYYYQKLCKAYEKKAGKLPNGFTPALLEEKLNLLLPALEANELSTYMILMEKGCFSRDGITKTEMLYIKKKTKEMRQKIKK